MRHFVIALALLAGCTGTEGKDPEPVDSDLPVDADGDGFDVNDDCDDTDALVRPGADETCNGVDDDCDGDVDEQAIDAPLWYSDLDGDGAAGTVMPTPSCTQPTGGSAENVDCDDLDDAVFPGADERCNDLDDDCDGAVDEDGIDPRTWYDDQDGDGFGGAITTESCAAPAGHVAEGGDCDDLDAAKHPEAGELCNGLDDDCDDLVDDADDDPPSGTTPFYADADGDGFGALLSTLSACAAPAGFVADHSDCQDGDPAVHPQAVERCNGVDDNCNGDIDDEDDDLDASDGATWWIDADEDGYGAGSPVLACGQPAGHVANDEDCADSDDTVHPDAAEVCNGVDDDCDGQTDSADLDVDPLSTTRWYADLDGDGFGGSFVSTVACDQPPGATLTGDDCNDASPAIHPDATEACNGLDDDCDGLIDDEDDVDGETTAWFLDGDGDGHGDGEDVVQACDAPAGRVALGDDCDDANVEVNPGAAEICNSVDDNCDDRVDDGDPLLDTSTATQWWADQDGDGHAGPWTQRWACEQPAGMLPTADDCNDADPLVSPSAVETCRPGDDNCDGAADEADPLIDLSTAPTWYRDEDADGWGGVEQVACSQPPGHVAQGGDCEDGDAAVNPGQAEVCNEVDDDCNTFVDDEDPLLSLSSTERWWIDRDGDGAGGTWFSVLACTAPLGMVAEADDCDDDDPAVYPDAPEVCDGADNNCDAAIDDEDPALDLATAPSWYGDGDGDGWGSAGDEVRACEPPLGYGTDTLDCDDADAAVNPNANEICNSIDDNCDGLVDDADPELSPENASYWGDDDLDGFGTPSRFACVDYGFGWTDVLGDCDDNDGNTYPGAEEICDYRDNDCNNSIDDDATDASLWYVDADRDGWGTSETVLACNRPSAASSQEGDCDDTRSDVSPNATEVCDTVDNNCNGIVDADTFGLPEWFVDGDGDGHGMPGTGLPGCSPFDGRVDLGDDCDDEDALVSPSEVEIDGNGLDDDCDGNVDLPTPVIGALIDTDTTWGAVDSLLSVSNNLLVTSGTTLTIEPCTHVLFDAGTTLQIEGTLIARGTPDCPIVLTSGAADPQPGDWSRLFFTATSVGGTRDAQDAYVSGSILEHVEVHWGGAVTAAVVVEAPAAPYMSYLTVADSQNAGIQTRADDNWLDHGVLLRNGGDGYRTYEPYASHHINDTRSEYNQGSGLSLPGGCCGPTSTRLARNTLRFNQGRGLYIDGRNGDWNIEDNWIEGNSTGIEGVPGLGNFRRNIIIGNTRAMRIGYSGMHRIENNVFADNGDGVETTSGGDFELRNNHFVRNGWAHRSTARGGSRHTVEHNLFQAHTGSDAVLRFNAVSVTSPTSTANHNNFMDIVGHYGLDVSHRAGSPVIDAEGNYWDGADLSGSASLVYDFIDDASLAVADIEPVVLAPHLDVPVSVPHGLTVVESGGGYQLTWLGNPESDVAGYRVWYGFGDAGYQLVGTGAVEGDAGMQVSGLTATVSGLDVSLPWRFALTAVDTDADGTADWTDGHESWFTEIALP